MASREIKNGLPDGDRAVAVETQRVERLAAAFRPYERHHFSIAGPDGAALTFDRDVLRAGQVVGMLPVDLARREVVLIRQFRIAGHIATGRGEMVELPAGRVDPGETPEAAARRECIEEIELVPRRVVEIMKFLMAPAFTDETMHLFLAEVDAEHVPSLAGHAEEGEIIMPFRVPIDGAIALGEQGHVMTASLIIALQWLRANAKRLGEVFAEAQGNG